MMSTTRRQTGLMLAWHRPAGLDPRRKAAPPQLAPGDPLVTRLTGFSSMVQSHPKKHKKKVQPCSLLCDAGHRHEDAALGGFGVTETHGTVWDCGVILAGYLQSPAGVSAPRHTPWRFIGLSVFWHFHFHFESLFFLHFLIN